MIVDVSTTCGCTAATYDKRPAKPGESLRVGIKMTPKDTGFFDEVVTIKYNSINNQPVKVKIKGMFGDRTNGSLLQPQNVQANSGDPEKEVYDGNITGKTE